MSEKTGQVRGWILAVIVASVLLLGFVICPRTPGKGRVDPNELVKAALGENAPKSSVFPLGPKGIRPVLRTLENPKLWTPFVEGEEKISGKDCWILRFRPAKRRTTWVQCWIDKENHVILAARIWNGQNRLIASASTIH